jgi:DUF4097 and DUF4098 domain-containing protein YvlB
MNLRLLAGALLFTVSTAAFAADKQFERTLDVTAQPDLYVSTGSGDITVHPGSDTQIHIVGHIHVGWSMFGDMQSRIDRIISSPPIVQTGNSIRVGESTDRGLYQNLSIDYDITAPASVALNLHSGSGDVVIDHLGRYLSASSGSGDIRAHGINGASELATGSGDIELESIGAGDIKARTGSGTIKVHGFNGSLTARTGSGDIQAAGHLTGPANLASGSGSINLHLTPEAHFNLEASTGSGDIHVNFPGAPEQDDHSRHHLTAPINGGGPPLEVRTGSGDVSIDSH